MRDPEETNIEAVRGDSDELVRRLRHLQWPSVRSDVRDRCWQAFDRRLAGRPGEPELKYSRNAGSRFDYRRRSVTAKVPAAQTGLGPRSWAARPTRRIHAFVA